MIRPQHHKSARLRLVPAALGLGAAVVLGGCSAGQTTETETQVAAVNGASKESGDIAIRDAQFTFPQDGTAYPQGSSAPVQLMIANSGETSDRLVGASSPYAASVDISGTTELPGDTALHAYGEQAPGAEGSGYVQPTSNSDQREVAITVNGFTEEIDPGVTIPVTFRFAEAGEITVQVPIGQDHRPRPEHGSPQPE
ncbi:copper chaperone PCu(A)C [Salinifilum ghardaiensis]